MLYDTVYRHNQALSPAGLTNIPTALHAVISAVDDCRRAGKSADGDAAVLLLVRHLAGIAMAQPLDLETLATRCRADREIVLARPALMRLAGERIGGNPAAKRTFHFQARRALAALADVLGLATPEPRVTTTLGADHEDGMSELRHADLYVRVVPRGFEGNDEVCAYRCRVGEPYGPALRLPVASLLDPSGCAQRLAALIQDPIVRVAA